MIDVSRARRSRTSRSAKRPSKNALRALAASTSMGASAARATKATGSRKRATRVRASIGGTCIRKVMHRCYRPNLKPNVNGFTPRQREKVANVAGGWPGARCRRLVLVELVDHSPEGGEGVLQEFVVELLVVLRAQRLFVLALADLVPAVGDLLADRMRRHRRAPK